MLLISGFQKKYQGELVLAIDRIEFPPGIYWIKGQNGSGKSTLFKSVAGLIPFEGNISFLSVDLQRKPVHFRKLVNYGEAEPIYPGFLTAKDLIRFVGKTKGATPENMSNITQFFGVDAFYEKACETFSSGMLKKLSLVLAFLGNPKLIILDEPLITLDESTRTKLIELIRNYLKQGVTFLVSSHQPIDENLPMDAIFQISNRSISRV